MESIWRRVEWVRKIGPLYKIKIKMRGNKNNTMTQNLRKPLMDFITREIGNRIIDLTKRKGDDPTKIEKFDLCIDELTKLRESILSHDYDSVAKADSDSDADYKETTESRYEIQIITNLFSYVKPTHMTKFTPDLVDHHIDIIIPDDDPMLLLSEEDLDSISESIKTIDLATCWHQSAMFKFCKLAKSWLRKREHDVVDLDQEKDATIIDLNLLKTRLGDITKQLYLKENQLEVNQDKDIEEQVSKFYKEQEDSKFIESLLKKSLQLYIFGIQNSKTDSCEESKSNVDMWSSDDSSDSSSSDEEQNESKSDVKQSSILEKNKEEPSDRKRLSDPFGEQQEKSSMWSSDDSSDSSSDEEQNESKSDVKQSSILEKNKEEPSDRKRLRDPFEEQQEKSSILELRESFEEQANSPSRSSFHGKRSLRTHLSDDGGFVAFTTDYHPPRHHPPKNNK